jgi:hypothetical protein
VAAPIPVNLNPENGIFAVVVVCPFLVMAVDKPTAKSASVLFAHVLLMNPVAVIMTALGGYLFAKDYARHQSLALACLEHALYGCWVFTLGLGIFFYTGAAWK